MDTASFKTKSEIIERKLPRVNGNNQYKGKTILALDGGYSGVKGASSERVFIFPSYAKKAPEDLEIIGKVRQDTILFRNNKTQEVWLVGQSAETMMDQVDLDSTTDASLYTRYRYDSDVFKVIMSTGLALGLWGTPEDNEIVLQTGLPSRYKKGDEEPLKDVLAGDYDIAIRIGTGSWKDFKFTLDRKNIYVMEQPQGTLNSIIYSNGELTDLGKDILLSNSIIFDVGFGTEDIFSVRGGIKNGTGKTYSDTAMRAVFDTVIQKIKETYPESDLKVFELQNYLVDGVASYFDPRAFQMKYINFSDILEETNRNLCEKSILRLMQDFQNLKNYKYLIITGGTGESRYEQIKEKLSVIPTLTVLPGNMNTPDLSFSYSNVIGYYMVRLALTARDMKKSEAGK